ncbi:flagellar motor protein MotB [Glacieibacterium megasporae]|uniref:flagellar motor protein MotB n=1 Tax=Glacieibacterium megasporae TaxID=2835787 RepID=UPI001C1DEF16|nr:flagellar motor protein MotB [Polymorphobacter megasporae]UAJ08674.1 OmpA family protein [Polymorphobacter megasporae]
MKPEPHGQFTEPVIRYRKVKGHAAAHGGAWKIAYADFVTAMMAFFMLMWILGATNEDQRRGIADYFTPTVIQMQNSGGSNGIGGGRALRTDDGVAPHASVRGQRPTPVQGGGGGGPLEAKVNSHDKATNPGNSRAADEERFKMVERIVNARIAGDPTLKGLKGQIRFVRTHDGLRIDLVERADFSMFGSGTSVLTSAAAALVRTVATALAGVPNSLTVRGHTDGVAYARGGVNNWTLSTARADATRRALTGAGTADGRFRRIEGVADTDPYNPKDANDPRNRRISVTLMYKDGGAPI